jgi:hypothetical protein
LEMKSNIIVDAGPMGFPNDVTSLAHKRLTKI